MSYKPMRGYVPLVRKSRRIPNGLQLAVCASYRQGDEMACKCGKRWPVGEDHP